MDKILIADDNVQITRILSEFARQEGYEPVIAYNGEEVLEMFCAYRFSVILLDVMMPKKDGFEVCREIRRSSNVPIIMITARGEDFEKIMGLDIGADDYIVKPFSGSEVMARVRAVLRRMDGSHREAGQNTLVYDNLCVCLDDGVVTIENQQIALTKKELEILWTLLENRGKIFSRDNLLNNLWGYDYYGDNRTVDSHIKRLRAKLDKVSHPNWQIKTIWGMGYKFEGAVS
ncbi:MAG: response regulator transcription factor [Lachnospiraceae bacterium]|nr:response regulator transcription factor [Lachnospiraceae bacterium]